MSMSEALSARIKNVQLAVFDVDGVMTDGSLVYGGGSTGEEIIKVFNTLDGHGMKMLQRSGVKLAIISGRGCKALEKRAEHLGIKHLMQHVENKAEAYAQLLQRLGLTPSLVASIGDRKSVV